MFSGAWFVMYRSTFVVHLCFKYQGEFGLCDRLDTASFQIPDGKLRKVQAKQARPRINVFMSL